MNGVSDRATTHRRRTVVRTAAQLCLLLVAAHGRVAGSMAPLGYVAEHWSVEDGLPNNALTSVLQTRDGYVWISAWAGIARFDGVRFTPAAADLPNDHARALLEGPDGSMWIGLSATGVARWHPRGTDLFTPEQGLAGVYVRKSSDPSLKDPMINHGPPRTARTWRMLPLWSFLTSLLKKLTTQAAVGPLALVEADQYTEFGWPGTPVGPKIGSIMGAKLVSMIVRSSARLAGASRSSRQIHCHSRR
jgi:hypothetical protein